MLPACCWHRWPTVDAAADPYGVDPPRSNSCKKITTVGTKNTIAATAAREYTVHAALLTSRAAHAGNPSPKDHRLLTALGTPLVTFCNFENNP